MADRNAQIILSLQNQITPGLKSLGVEFGALGAIVTVATKTVQAFGDALHFEGQLQQQRAAFDGVYGSVLVGNAVLDKAIAQTRAYGFTTEETTSAFKQLAPIIRESTSSTADQAGALERISVLHPEDPANALARAIEGIRKGRFQEIAGEMGLNKAEAKALAAEVAHGKDAFIALNDALDKHGITLDVAKTRMDGYAGAEKRAVQAGEDLQKAEAAFASGPGLVILEARIRATNDATNLLGGDVRGLNDILKDTGVSAINPLLGSLQAYNSYVLDAGHKGLVWAGVLHEQAPAANAAANAVLRSADADDRVAAAAAQATKYVEALTTAQYAQAKAALADQRAGERSGGQFDNQAELTTFKDRQHAAAKEQYDAAQQAAAQAKQLNDLQTQNRLINAKTAADKIAILKQERSAETDPLKRQQLQNQIDQEIIAAAKVHGAGRISVAQSTALQLNNVEENSGLQLLKTQRENNERLADSQQDFDLRRSRSKEDEDRKIQGLLARGQKAAADRERADFARQQGRDQQDFNIARQRTIRNNNEATGDLGNRTALRTDQIQDRAALRGVRVAGAAGGGAPETGGGFAGPSAASGGSSGRVIQVMLPSSLVTPDGKQIATIVYPFIAAQIDADLSIELRGANPPGSNQTAVAGARP